MVGGMVGTVWYTMLRIIFAVHFRRNTTGVKFCTMFTVAHSTSSRLLIIAQSVAIIVQRTACHNLSSPTLTQLSCLHHCPVSQYILQLWQVHLLPTTNSGCLLTVAILNSSLSPSCWLLAAEKFTESLYQHFAVDLPRVVRAFVMEGGERDLT